MLVTYLLTQQLPVATDAVDRAGRTCLQWAAYQGDGISVDLMLKHGADPNKKDPGGLTALHVRINSPDARFIANMNVQWAVVKGNVNCIAKIIEAGADPSLKNNENQTPFELARQLNSVSAWQRAMQSISREPDGRIKARPLSEKNTTAAIMILPCVMLYVAFKTFTILPWYTALPVVAAEWFGLHHVVVRVLLDASASDDRISTSPYLAGVLGGSVICVGWTWLTTLVTREIDVELFGVAYLAIIDTSGLATSNLVFAISYLVCAYNFVRALTLDPGYVPKLHSEINTKEVSKIVCLLPTFADPNDT